ncbi:uncharacterized protein ACR2FA_002328 [Aphomia sociella]
MINDSISDEDLSDSEFLANCERDATKEEIKKCGEKRKQRDDETSEEADGDFTTVTKRKTKRLIERGSEQIQKNKLEEGDHEVSLISLECLPKQIAMAKLLRSENIKGITRIKYKSPYKALIQFKNRVDATKLMECEKMKQLDIRCQMLYEQSLSYGVVKGVDLNLTEKELLEIFDSTIEINSLKRLKRIGPDGKWIDSESIKICFKDNKLPMYVFAYDCRFKVEAYVFPVTQCSGCWKFGHIIKYCPTKKILCPKCGCNHNNCETINFKCLNCKGDHFVLNKKCPFFLKEKEIRNIMSEEQVSYRKALGLYLEKRKTKI